MMLVKKRQGLFPLRPARAEIEIDDVTELLRHYAFYYVTTSVLPFLEMSCLTRQKLRFSLNSEQLQMLDCRFPGL